ncbi:MAG TPA: NAD(P)-dependent oxidoreductase [Saprospiraceae bacterium]|nr:NAD(P)-dependent oxidoreductase [Saprospiraceae bacterium]
MRCFITGVSGFIGFATAKQLITHGHEVTGLTSSKSHFDPLKAAGIKPVLGDMRHPHEWIDAAHSAEAVIHLATLPLPSRPGMRYVKRLLTAQELILTAMLDTVSDSFKSFVCTSAVSIYGFGSDEKTEETPISPYRIAQPFALCEKLVQRAVKDKGLPGMILRLGGVYGNGGVFGKFWTEPMLKGKRAGIPGNGKQLFSFVHIDDCVQAFVRCVEDPIPGGVFNIVDNDPAPVGKVIQSLANEMKSPRPFHIPSFMFRLAAGPLVSELLLNDKVANNKKMVGQLGVKLKYPTYREGIPALARTLRNYA